MERISVKLKKAYRPYAIVKIPLILKIYAWSMASNRTGAMWVKVVNYLVFLAVFIWQRFWPFRSTGILALGNKTLRFNAKNTQFDCLYRSGAVNGYEPEVESILDKLVKDTEVFYDVGSNWGYFTWLVSTNPSFRGKVFSFEPFPETYKDLISIYEQLGLSVKDIVTCLPIALSNVNGKATMRYKGFIHSGFAQIEANHGLGLRPKAKVDVRTLDSVDLPPPSLIKIDAQYHEHEVLMGAIRTLKKYNPYVILENCLDFDNYSNTLKPLKLLEKAGYKLYFPVWEVKKGTNIPSEADHNNVRSDTLSIVSFRSGDRFLLRDQINVFACHESKVASLF